MIESTADSEQNGTLPATSPSATTPSSTSAASATIPGVVWWFASEYGVPGTAVSVEIAGLADYVGEPVDFYFASVAGDASAGAGSGVVDESGRTKVDFYVPNRFEEDEMDVEPGEYVVSGALKSRRGPDSFESRLEVRRAVPGESYRTVLGYGCAEVIWFDTKLWFAADEGVERATIPASAGTIRLIDDSRAVFTSTETGDVALRLSTPEEAAAFGPPTTYCHG